MSRLVPYPVLSVALLAFWLLLQGSVAPANLLSGVVLALIAPWTLVALEMPPLRLRRPGAVVKLVSTVLFDVIRSNIAVARIIFSGKRRTRSSGFVIIPLDMRNQYGLTILAAIITSTPGTLWVQYDSRRNRLLMHIFDLRDPEDWPPLIKGRYECLLMEIFE